MAARHILVVSSEAEVARRLGEALCFEDVETAVVQSTEAAVACFNGDTELVLLDLASLGDTGVTLCATLRDRAEGRVVPLLFLGSGLESVASAEDALQAGGDGYLQRPLPAARIAAKVQTYLGRPLRAPLRSDAMIDEGELSADATTTASDLPGIGAAIDDALGGALQGLPSRPERPASDREPTRVAPPPRFEEIEPAEETGELIARLRRLQQASQLSRQLDGSDTVQAVADTWVAAALEPTTRTEPAAAAEASGPGDDANPEQPLGGDTAGGTSPGLQHALHAATDKAPAAAESVTEQTTARDAGDDSASADAAASDVDFAAALAEARHIEEQAIALAEQEDQHKASTDAQRLEEDARAKAKAEAEAERIAFEAKVRTEAAARRLEDEARAKAKAEAEAERIAFEAKVRTEAAARRLEDEARAKAEAEAERVAFEAMAKAEAQARQLEEEARAKAKVEAERIASEARAKAEAQARKLEEDARSKAEVEARKLEEEARARAETEARQLEADARAQAEAEARRIEDEVHTLAARRARELTERITKDAEVRARDEATQLEQEARLLAEESARQLSARAREQAAVRARELAEAAHNQAEAEAKSLEQHAAEQAETEARAAHAAARQRAEQRATKLVSEARHKAELEARRLESEARQRAEDEIQQHRDETLRRIQETARLIESEGRQKAEGDARELEQAAQERARNERERLEAEARQRADEVAQQLLAQARQHAAALARELELAARAQAEAEARELEALEIQRVEEQTLRLRDDARRRATERAAALDEQARQQAEREAAELEDRARAAAEARARELFDQARQRTSERVARIEADASARAAAEEQRVASESHRIAAELEHRLEQARAREQQLRQLQHDAARREDTIRQLEETARQRDEELRLLEEEARRRAAEAERRREEGALRLQSGLLEREQRREKARGWLEGLRSERTEVGALLAVPSATPASASTSPAAEITRSERKAASGAPEPALAPDHSVATQPIQPRIEAVPRTIEPAPLHDTEPGRPRPRLDLPPSPLSPEQGAFDDGQLPTLLVEVAYQQVTGRLDFALEGGAAQRSVYLEQGAPVLLRSTLRQDRFEDFLLRHGLLTREQHALARAKNLPTARQLAASLLEEGVLKTRELFDAVRAHLRAGYLALFEWPRGSFRYQPEKADESERVTLAQGPLPLVAEGVRCKYDVERLLRAVGGPSTLLRPVERSKLEPMGLSADEQHAASLLDGVRTLEDLILAAGVDEVVAYRTALIAIACGSHQVVARGIDVLDADRELVQAHEQAIDRARVMEKWQQAREQDYFSFLGLTREATGYEVEQAVGHLLEELETVRLGGQDDRELKGAIAEIWQVAQDALAVLRDERSRGRYRRHLR